MKKKKFVEICLAGGIGFLLVSGVILTDTEILSNKLFSVILKEEKSKYLSDPIVTDKIFIFEINRKDSNESHQFILDNFTFEIYTKKLYGNNLVILGKFYDHAGIISIIDLENIKLRRTFWSISQPYPQSTNDGNRIAYVRSIQRRCQTSCSAVIMVVDLDQKINPYNNIMSYENNEPDRHLDNNPAYNPWPVFPAQNADSGKDTISSQENNDYYNVVSNFLWSSDGNSLLFFVSNGYEIHKKKIFWVRIDLTKGLGRTRIIKETFDKEKMIKYLGIDGDPSEFITKSIEWDNDGCVVVTMDEHFGKWGKKNFTLEQPQQIIN